jgi:hypothetical protein
MLDPVSVISGEAYIGYLKQKYEDQASRIRQVRVTAATWNVSRLTSITFTGTHRRHHDGCGLIGHPEVPRQPRD